MRAHIVGGILSLGVGQGAGNGHGECVAGARGSQQGPHGRPPHAELIVSREHLHAIERHSGHCGQALKGQVHKWGRERGRGKVKRVCPRISRDPALQQVIARVVWLRNHARPQQISVDHARHLRGEGERGIGVGNTPG